MGITRFDKVFPLIKKLAVIIIVASIFLVNTVTALAGGIIPNGPDQWTYFTEDGSVAALPIQNDDNGCCPISDANGKKIVMVRDAYGTDISHIFPHMPKPEIVLDAFGHNPNEIKGVLAKDAYMWAVEIFSNDIIDKTESLLRISIDGGYKRFWLTIKKVYNAIVGIGVVVAVIYFLLALLEKVKHELANLESVAKLLMKLLVAILIINNGLPVLEGSFKFSNAMLDTVTSINTKIVAESIKPKDVPPEGTIIAITDTGTGGDSKSAAQKIVDEYWVRAIETTDDPGDSISHLKIGFGMVIELIIPHLMISIINILAQVLCYSRAIELFVRMAFAPIGMVNIFQGGVNSAGMRYFKKIIAVFLQGAGMLVIVFGYQALTNVITSLSSSSDLATNLIIFNQVLLGFAMITLMIKTHSWINDLMGV